MKTNLTSSKIKKKKITQTKTIFNCATKYEVIVYPLA